MSIEAKSAKTHVTKTKTEDIDAWQAGMQTLVEEKNVPLFLIGNKDETPTKLNVSTAHTVDIKGMADVRYKDQGQLKSQFTTYCGGWTGALKTTEELLMDKPERITINDFINDGHLLPCMSIFKGKTAQALVNVLVETTCFDAMYNVFTTPTN